MVEVDIEEIGEEDTLPKEADEAEEANKSITDEILELQKRKEEVKEKLKEEAVEESKEEKKVKPKTNIDLTKLNIFKDKIIKEFGLEEKIDKNQCFGMYYKGYIIFKLLPRKNCWYGVWREVPENNNKWKVFRVHNAEEEQIHYNHIKVFIEVNNKD